MKIISGGQTGVDTAALETALLLRCDYGGWIPKGRKKEGGTIDPKFDRLVENDTETYAERTRLNVGSSDVTLVITKGDCSAGTARTVECAEGFGKPLLTIDLAESTEREAAARIRRFLLDVRPAVLNIAGPRESEAPGIERATMGLLIKSLSNERRELALGPDYRVEIEVIESSCSRDRFRMGEIFHVRRNRFGSGSFSTPIARVFAWRARFVENFNPHWQVHCLVREHELSPEPGKLGRELASTLIDAGICDEPVWVSWHRSEELGGEAIGEVFADD